MKSQPALNGQLGLVTGWNEEGTRRFGVRLAQGGKRLSLKPRNLLGVDRCVPFPAACDFSAAELCEELQRELEVLISY